MNLAQTCEKVPNIVPKQADTLINKKGVTMPIVNQVVPAENHTISDDPDSHDDQSIDSSQFSWI